MVVSAALKADGLPRRVLSAISESGGLIALSAPVFAEYQAVLDRPKFAGRFSPDDRAEVMDYLLLASVWVVSPAVRVTDCRDAKDNIYLELALATGAASIVSGDTDLLVLDPWRGVRIMPPAAFLAVLTSA